MIAMEKPKAMITKNALIFLLETFLTALVKAPKLIHLSTHDALNPEKEEWQAVIFSFFLPGLKSWILWGLTAAISLITISIPK
ncbi:hypothetical protein HXY33_04650 [Candidatus Bathyarchaeota archaeon]|nr:hypothetical protein [Candidatus Bathyarchaeota archaeon]